MLTKAIIQTSTPMTLDIESVDPDEILILKSISGLSTPGATLFTGDFARDGGYYQGRRAKNLTPVFNFKMNPSYKDNISASDIREMLYRMFMEPQDETDAVQITVVDDKLPDRYFFGHTEDINADHFEKDLTATVSMKSMDPHLSSVIPISASHEYGWVKRPVKYDGSKDIGLSITLKVVFRTSTLTFINNNTAMTLTRAFEPDDVITINTIQGQRSIQLNGVDIMVALSAGSEWVKMSGPNNVLSAYGLYPGDGRVVITDYTYRSAWWGV